MGQFPLAHLLAHPSLLSPISPVTMPPLSLPTATTSTSTLVLDLMGSWGSGGILQDNTQGGGDTPY